MGITSVLRAVVFAAVAAGLLAGFVVSAVQVVTTTPLILAAEKYERAAASAAPARPAQPGPTPESHSDSHGMAEAGGWKPADGIERLGYTALANMLIGVGFALILTGCFALSGRPVDGRRGVLWGAAGFAVFTLAPGLGLPPEPPGAGAGGLEARQLWWLLAVAGAAIGLWLLVFRRGAVSKALGLLAMTIPHLAGPPSAHQLTHAVPAELAAHFAAASIVTAAVFWASLGWLAGTFYARLRPAGAAPAPAQ